RRLRGSVLRDLRRHRHLALSPLPARQVAWRGCGEVDLKQDRALIALLAGWMVFSVASIWLRPLWPVDETRYASVAWGVWLRGGFLVPYINGEAYRPKP